MHAGSIVLLCLQALLALFAAFYVYYDWKLGVAAVPSSAAAGRAVAALVPQGAGAAVDLGSGWGGLAVAVARACPDTQVTGIEYAWPPYLFSRLRLRLNPALKNLTFVRGDIFKYPLADVHVVICYMPPEMMLRLAPKLEKELRAGAIVISNSAALPGRLPESTVDVPALLLPEKIYVYKVAA